MTRYHHVRADRSAAWSRIKRVLNVNSVAPQTDEMHATLLTRPYLTLDELAAGKMDFGGFVLLNKMNACACILAGRLHDNGSTEMREVIMPTRAAFETAAEALQGIGERFTKTGRFGANGEQLTALRVSVDLLDQLVRMAPQGVTLVALQDATDAIAFQGVAHEDVR